MKRKYRILALFMAAVMLLTSIRFVSTLIPTVKAEDQGVVILDDAMHFVIRHWHMAEDGDAQMQGGQYDADAKEFFVIAEGYIMPDDNGSGYVCYAVSQDNGALVKVEEDGSLSAYVEKFESSTGKLYLNIKVITDDSGEVMEDYTGLSVSSGHSAIEYDGSNIVISYDPYVHLVKAHVFYNPTGKTVRGISAEEWPYFIETDLYNDENNEIDTIYVYTYIADDNNGHKAGEIYLGGDGKVIEVGKLPEGTDTSNLQLTKFYSSAEGLHTDNTVIAVDSDGRTFTVNLEAWYNEGYAPQIGFALDASGSMAFALNDPSPITVDEDFIRNNDIKQVTSNPDGNWDYYFLTNEQLKKILNPHNTDNSALSASGYSYFVYNGSAYEPLGYWEGTGQSALLSFNRGDYEGNLTRDWLLDAITKEQATKVNRVDLTGDFRFEQLGITDWPSDELKFSGISGFEAGKSGAGIMLDVSPTNGSFTVSFKMITTTTGDKTGDDRQISQLLYIGPKSGAGSADDTEDGNYYTLYRDQKSSANRLRGNQRNGRTGNVTDVNSIFNNSKTFTVTLVFENVNTNGGTVTTYIDGNVGDIGSGNGTPNAANGIGTPNVKEPLYEPISLENLCIVINGVADSYDGANIYIDEFALYDFALSSDQVKGLNNSSGTPNVAKTWNGDILGSINITIGKTTTSATLNHTRAGWYHISHAGEYFEHYLDIGTGKRLFGVAGSIGQTAEDENGYTYTPTKDEPTRFYIDEEFNLCCFYGVNTDIDGLSFSYVYELADKDYIRVEGLQRILGSFTNKLNQRSPSAKVSAVRYSSSTANLPLDELVLLDWTNDSLEMANMMSLDRGDGTAYGYTMSANGVAQYNYGLTGSTNTASGLQSYLDNLSAYVDPENPYKYFIVFTDGANTGDVDEAVRYAGLLKDAGYTIYAVALIADPNSSDYSIAEGFLSQLVGKEGDNNTDEYLFFANDMTALTDKFQDILDDITINLEGYTVTNYIDARFDLVDKNNNVWKLKADGEVLKGDGTTVTVSGTDGVTFSLSSESTPEARSPKLKFDADADLYYIEWTVQTVPTSPENADTIVVWNSVYKIRAKDDFIGGNAVLTNGNLTNMNWVRSPSDKDASSGTNDRKKEYDADTKQVIDEYPSKGFPRTVVNITLLPINTNPISSVIYMGEAVSPKQILTEIKDVYMTETYYLEYLKRFAYARYDVGRYRPDLKKQMDRPLLDLLTEWLEIENDNERVKAFSVPYMYLPAVEWDEESGKILLDEEGKAQTVYNNTGDVATNQRCIVGVLTYRWEQLDPTPATDYEPIKDYVKTDTDRVIYSLTVEFTPLRVGDSYELFYGTDESDTGGEESEAAEILTTAEGYPIVSLPGTGGVYDNTVTYAQTSKSPFEKYLRIDDDHKAVVQEDTRLDREKYINGNDSDIPDHRGDYALIGDVAYKWNKNYKPVVGTQELVATDKTPSETDYPYGNALMINDYGTEDDPDYRTLKAVSIYTADVVSGGIALELKLFIGELEKIVAANGDFKYSFTVPATRSFRDTSIVEELKKTKYNGENGNSVWEDYGSKFNITFSFDYTAADIAGLEQDEDGYVTIYAKTTKIEAPENNFKSVGGKAKTYSDTELPIGTYEIAFDGINDELPEAIKDNIHFAAVEADNKSDLLPEYFQQDVLSGLHTTKNGMEWSGSEKRDSDGKIIEGDNAGSYEDGDAEITENNIEGFRAPGTTATDKTVSFYIGTAVPDTDPTEPYVPVRGKVTENPYVYNKDNYINNRLSIFMLSTGMTKLTIEEEGGLSNESFVYHITGTTLGYKEVDLYVSVQGGNSATVIIPPGDYTVEEVSDWSWRYDNKDTYGKYDADDGEKLDEKWKIGKLDETGNIIDADDLTTASTSLRYRDDAEYTDAAGNIVHQTVEEHKTVIYVHKHNEKVWLGGESHKDNHFAVILQRPL